MQEQHVAQILRRLRSREAHDAWAVFLQLFSPVILQVVRLFERDPDRVADCFLFVCEQLSQKRFRRLRRFRPEGPASFSTWLRAVVRNLCLDWHRKEFGRERPFKAIASLSVLDQAVFRCLFVQGLSWEESLHSLRAQYPDLTGQELNGCEERLRRCLTRRQVWLLSVRHPRAVPVEEVGVAEEEILPWQLPDPGPSPEALAALKEQHDMLEGVLGRLPRADRLLVRLRFEQDMTLDQIARVTGLGNPQRVDRRIAEILERLRKEMP